MYTHPYPDPDTTVERVQQQIFQLKYTLKGAADGHQSPPNNMGNRHAGYLAFFYMHDENCTSR